MIWLTSDTHFCHRNIIIHCDRPYRTLDGQPDIQAMNRDMTAKWNSVVAPDDLVIHLGDFAWGGPGKAKAAREALNGRLWLIRGNHDSKPDKWLKPGVDRWAYSLQVGDIFFAHVPPTSPEKWRMDDGQYQQFILKPEKPAEGTRVWVAGHVHNRWKETTHNGIRVINVGADVNGLRPISLAEVGLGPEDTLKIHGRFSKEG